jgi:hypothetical protein
MNFEEQVAGAGAVPPVDDFFHKVDPFAQAKANGTLVRLPSRMAFDPQLHCLIILSHIGMHLPR